MSGGDSAGMPHRTGDVTVTVLAPDGTPLADTRVMVEQRRHAFAFGNIGFDLIPLANGERSGTQTDATTFGGASIERLEPLADRWLELFNTATLPFYWRGFEPERGHPDTARIEATAAWFAERGVTVKGHPLVWHTLAPEWLNGLPLDEVERLVRERITRDVSSAAGLIDIWDPINEVVIMPVFDKEENAITRLAQRLGRVGMIRLAFETARAANPDVTLLMNDFDLSERYERLIEEVLEAGIRVDAIGLQTHMHQGYWGEDVMLAMVDRFARFGLPLHLTESTLLSGDLMPPHIVDLNDWQVDHWPSTPEGEARQAGELVRHYRSLVSHPAVQAINYWGITDDGAWLGAPVGLVRADGSTKPSYDALRSLIKDEWWMPPTPLRTDAAGRVRVSGFLGDYAIGHEGRTAALTIDAAGDSARTVTPA